MTWYMLFSDDMLGKKTPHLHTSWII